MNEMWLLGRVMTQRGDVWDRRQVPHSVVDWQSVWGSRSALFVCLRAAEFISTTNYSTDDIMAQIMELLLSKLRDNPLLPSSCCFFSSFLPFLSLYLPDQFSISIPFSLSFVWCNIFLYPNMSLPPWTLTFHSAHSCRGCWHSVWGQRLALCLFVCVNALIHFSH